MGGINLYVSSSGAKVFRYAYRYQGKPKTYVMGNAVLLDAGFGFCAEKTADNIRSILGNRQLNFILLSHTHYDHVCGIPIIKRCYPEAKVVAGKHAESVFARESARSRMRSLDAAYAEDAGITACPVQTDELAVDTVLADGELLRLPGITIQAVATPGHTRCAMSYYFHENGLLACSETIGVATTYPTIIPGLIVGYRMTMDAIRRSKELRPKQALLSHYGIIPDDNMDAFFDRASLAVEDVVAYLLALHKRGCSKDEIVDTLLREHHPSLSAIQPAQAFALNARAMVPRILQEVELVNSRDNVRDFDHILSSCPAVNIECDRNGGHGGTGR